MAQAHRNINVCVRLAVLLVQHAKCTVKLNSYLKSKKLALFQVFYYVQGNLSSKKVNLACILQVLVTTSDDLSLLSGRQSVTVSRKPGQKTQCKFPDGKKNTVKHEANMSCFQIMA